MSPTTRVRLAAAAGVTAYLLLAAADLVAGRCHMDEGAYLYAARAVMQGKVLYRDLFFIQPPVAPYVYGLASKILGEGLLAGRATSIAAGLGALAAAMALAGRLSGRSSAAALTALLLGFNGFQVYFFTITRPYSLTALWFTLACLALTARRNAAGEALAGALLGLAAGTRLTVLPALPALAVYLVLRHRRRPLRIVTPLAAATAVLAAVYLPHYLAAPERFYFNLLGMNLSLHANNLAANLMEKARATSHLTRRYFFLWLVIVFVALYHRPRWATAARRALVEPGPGLATALIAGAVFAGHHLAKIYQESYQTFLMPAAAALAAAGAASIHGRIERSSLRTVLSGVVLAGCCLTLLAHGRTDIELVGGQLPSRALAEQARAISQLVPPGQVVFSADSALAAVEAQRDVLDGMAASDYFPDWPTERCREFHVTNDEIVLEYIRTRRAPALIIGDMSYTLSLPNLEPVPPERRARIMQAIEANYRLMRTFPNLFLRGTQTRLYAVRPGDAP